MKTRKQLQEKIYRDLVKESLYRSADEVSNDEQQNSIETTQPKFSYSPEERLLNKLFAAAQLKRDFVDKTPEEIADQLGFNGDDEIISLINNLMTSRLYARF